MSNEAKKPLEAKSCLDVSIRGRHPEHEGFFWVFKTEDDKKEISRQIGFFDGSSWKFPGKHTVTAYTSVYEWGYLPGYMGVAAEENSLRQIQNEIGAWSRKNFQDNLSKATGQRMFSTNALLGMVEEVGELSHAVLKRHQGIRGYDVDDKYIAERDDAIADILVYLCDFSFREGVDLQETLNAVWTKVSKRDWEKNKTDAHEKAEATPPAGKFGMKPMDD